MSCVNAVLQMFLHTPAMRQWIDAAPARHCASGCGLIADSKVELDDVNLILLKGRFYFPFLG